MSLILRVVVLFGIVFGELRATDMAQKKIWPVIQWEGKTRHNVSLADFDFDGATMDSKEGRFTIPLDAIPKSIQDMYPNEFAGAQARAKVFAKITKLKAEGAQKVKGKVLQRLDDGVVVMAERSKPARDVVISDPGNSFGRGSPLVSKAEKSKMPALTETQGQVVLKGLPNEKSLADGDSVDVIAKDEGVVSLTTVLGSNATLRIWRVIP